MTTRNEVNPQNPNHDSDSCVTSDGWVAESDYEVKNQTLVQCGDGSAEADPDRPLYRLSDEFFGSRRDEPGF